MTILELTIRDGQSSAFPAERYANAIAILSKGLYPGFIVIALLSR